MKRYILHVVVTDILHVVVTDASITCSLHFMQIVSSVIDTLDGLQDWPAEVIQENDAGAE